MKAYQGPGQALCARSNAGRSVTNNFVIATGDENALQMSAYGGKADVAMFAND